MLDQVAISLLPRWRTRQHQQLVFSCGTESNSRAKQSPDRPASLSRQMSLERLQNAPGHCNQPFLRKGGSVRDQFTT